MREISASLQVEARKLKHLNISMRVHVAHFLMPTESMPDGNRIELWYDAYENVVHAKDKQREVKFTYSPLGSLKTREEDGKKIVFYYNKDEELTGVLNEDKERYTFGRISKEIQDGHTVESTYNKAGERIHVGSSLGASIDLKFNNVGYLSQMQAAQNDTATWQMQLSYNGIGQETERILSGGVTTKHRYNLHGRLELHTVQSGNTITRKMEYRWGVNDRLMYIYDALTDDETGFNYDNIGTLIGADYPDGTKVFRTADAVGNLYKSADRKDRKYGPGGRLLETEDTHYHYDDEGNMTEKNKGDGEKWRYEWNADGSLKSVTRPDRKVVSFEYDPLGRRTAKIFDGYITRWVWDGNTPLHEWKYKEDDRPKTIKDEFGFKSKDKEEPIENLTTWVFEEGTFKPAAKITENKQYSIITDYLGTPAQMYDEKGEKKWDCTLDVYGKVSKFEGSNLSECPFRYQGQYEDEETGLYYNRFRYYSPDEGIFISQDPIGLEGNNPTFYGYVEDTNTLVDVLGLYGVTRNTPAWNARANQKSSGYSSDSWRTVTLKKGTVVYGGVPGQTPYYMSESTFKANRDSAPKLWTSLQVQENPKFGYRTQVQKYVLTEDVKVATGSVLANPKYGNGGGEQFFIENYKNTLQPEGDPINIKSKGCN